MILLLVIGVLVVALLTFLLVTPIIIEVDSELDRPLRLIWRGIGMFSVFVEGDRFWGEFRAFGFHRQFPFKGRPKQKAERPTKKQKRSRFTMRMAINLIRSFRIRELVWHLDTGDFVLNARLFAVAALLSRPHIGIFINFTSSNSLRVTVTNRLISLIWAYVRK